MMIKPEYFVLKFTEGPYFTHPILLVVSIREYEVIKILRGFRKRPGYNFLRHVQPDEKYEDNELELAYSVYLSSHIYSLSLCTKEERLEEILSYLKSRYIKSSFHILDLYEY